MERARRQEFALFFDKEKLLLFFLILCLTDQAGAFDKSSLEVPHTRPIRVVIAPFFSTCGMKSWLVQSRRLWLLQRTLLQGVEWGHFCWCSSRGNHQKEPGAIDVTRTGRTNPSCYMPNISCWAADIEMKVKAWHPLHRWALVICSSFSLYL